MDAMQEVERLGKQRAGLLEELELVRGEIAAAARKAKEQGESVQAIADAAGVSRQAVYMEYLSAWELTSQIP